MFSYHFGYGAYGPARSGKRLRPQLLVRVALAEGARAEDALDAAVAIEMLHNYSLVHDDIEDGDELRRGRQTLWSRYGLAQAVNAGDALCAIAFLSLLQANAHHTTERVMRLVRVLHEAHRVMCEGQSLDLAFETAGRVDRAGYFEMIGAKTAALFAAACEMGALCASCDDRAVQRYGELGRAYGVAFQIRDDERGVWASSDASGKVPGRDIARRKWTYPVVWALDGPPSAARATIAQAYEKPGALDSRTVSGVIAALDSLGARDAAGRAIAEQLRIVEHHPTADLRDLLINSLEMAT